MLANFNFYSSHGLHIWIWYLQSVLVGVPMSWIIRLHFCLPCWVSWYFSWFNWIIEAWVYGLLFESIVDLGDTIKLYLRDPSCIYGFPWYTLLLHKPQNYRRMCYLIFFNLAIVWQGAAGPAIIWSHQITQKQDDFDLNILQCQMKCSRNFVNK